MQSTNPGRPNADEHAPAFAGYIASVPHGDLVNILQAQLDTTRALLAPLSRELTLARPKPDDWNILEVLGHITDAEQPLARGDLQSLAELRRAAGIPIAAQESVSSPEDALAVLEARAADLLKIKLTHIGGFQRGLDVAAVVGARGLPVVIGQGSACTTILSAAEMQLHCALKNAQPGGEMTGFMRLGEQDIFSPIRVSRGTAHPPMTAGQKCILSGSVIREPRPGRARPATRSGAPP